MSAASEADTIESLTIERLRHEVHDLTTRLTMMREACEAAESQLDKVRERAADLQDDDDIRFRMVGLTFLAAIGEGPYA